MASQKKQQDLESMTRDELYEMAREQDVPGKSGMNKEELIHALSGSQKGGSSQKGESRGRDSHQAQGHAGRH